MTTPKTYSLHDLLLAASSVTINGETTTEVHEADYFERGVMIARVMFDQLGDVFFRDQQVVLSDGGSFMATECVEDDYRDCNTYELTLTVCRPMTPELLGW